MSLSLPCVVLGLETQIGLGVVRELGRAGVKVVGVAHSGSAIGLSSRYLWKGLVASKPRSQELIDLLSGLGATYGPCPLLTVSEANMLWLQAHASEVSPLKPVLPPASALDVVLDKAQTIRAAKLVGIDVPESWQPMSADDVAVRASEFPCPAVLKWSDPNRIASRLQSAGLALLKAEYVDDPAALRAALQRFNVVESWPLVQQYCAGSGLGQFFYMKDGLAVRRFQHRRVAEWPPEGGVSSVADAVPLSRHTELQEKSVQLLRSIGWQGVAMVEYRFDDRSGRAWLMEVNGRFWGSFPLAVHSGAGFALLSYLDGCGASLPKLPSARDDLRCRMVGTEVKRLRRLLFQREQILDRRYEVRPVREVLRFLSDFLRPRSRYYVADLDDPRPLMTDLNNLRSK
jgi:predicted ATP-grasp superfamily ATP-dependent carboligase